MIYLLPMKHCLHKHHKIDNAQSHKKSNIVIMIYLNQMVDQWYLILLILSQIQLLHLMKTKIVLINM